jgi:hypothetical protein
MKIILPIQSALRTVWLVAACLPLMAAERIDRGVVALPLPSNP